MSDHDCRADLAAAFAPTLALLGESGLVWRVECVGGNCHALVAEWRGVELLVTLHDGPMACGFTSSDGDAVGWRVGWQCVLSGDTTEWADRVATPILLDVIADALIELSTPREDVPGRA